MKKLIIAAAVLAATVTAAQAKCSKAAMEGEWQFSYEAGGSSARLVFDNGNILNGGALVGTYTMAKSCKGTVIISGVPVIFTSRADKIDEDSDMKPGTLSFGYDNGAGAGLLWHMMRL